jgi:hypothetical protein
MDDDEIEELKALYAPLRHFAGIVAPAGTAPDDLVQEVFTRVIERGGLGVPPACSSHAPGANCARFWRKTMSTLPDLFERLAEHGDHAGADAVVARALSTAHNRPVAIPLTVDAGPRRSRRYAALLTAAVLTVALIAVPIALNRSGNSSPPSRQPIGPAYPAPAPVTAAQLATMHWSRIAAAPIPLIGANQLMAWAGKEVVVFGEDAQHEDPHGIGAAYTPATNRWRMLPKAPLKGTWFFKASWVWTGRELVVFPNTLPDIGAPRGEAYSPRTNSWRVLAPAPLCTVPQAGIVWTGQTIVLAGGYNVTGSQCSDARVALSASYDLRTDRWTRGPSIPVRSGDRLEATSLVWAQRRLFAIVASQRRSAGPPTTAAVGSTTTATASPANEPVTATDPIVLAYEWQPAASSWRPLGAITGATFGETPQDRWTPYTAGSKIAFPPSLRFCGEGNEAPCSFAGVQPGTVYDVTSGRRVALALPKLGLSSTVDLTAFSGSAVISSVHDSSTSAAFAWDVATGRRYELAHPPLTALFAVWTGNELVAIAIPSGNGQMIGLRLGP